MHQQNKQCSFHHQIAEDVAKTAGAYLLCKPGRVKAVLLLAVLRHVVRHWLLRCLGTLSGRICANPCSSICIMGCRIDCNRQSSSYCNRVSHASCTAAASSSIALKMSSCRKKSLWSARCTSYGGRCLSSQRLQGL